MSSFVKGNALPRLPELPEGRAWWVIESLRFNHEAESEFRIFEAVIGLTKEEATLHLEQSDEKLNLSLMRSALERGQIDDSSEWTPVSSLVRYLAVTQVETEGEISTIDAGLLDMLREHDYFLEEFERDPATAIGGSFFEV